MGNACEAKTTDEARTTAEGPAGKTKKGPFRHWHGIIQGVTWSIFVFLCAGLTALVLRCALATYDALLLGGTCLAIAIALTCSHAYNDELKTTGGHKLRARAGKLRTIWLHANFCWQTVNVWMTLTPLYCTCIAIYLSGNEMDWEHVLIYSILSLVISLGVYAIRPANRAGGYRRAYQKVSEAVTEYDRAGGTEAVLGRLVMAINEGERIVADQDTLAPQ